MIAAIVIVASMCLQGGDQVDVSRYVVPTASVLRLKVTLMPASGTLLIYSPGYEDRQARFTMEESLGWVPVAEPILSVKAIGGPFEFNIEVMPVEDVD
jgi:hypothetical protein